MNNQNKTTIFEGLKLYEASVRRMQNSKPQFASVFEVELQQIADAKKAVNETPLTNSGK